MARACLCGTVGCTRHGRRSSKRRTGAYGGQYQTNRAVLLRRWISDPSTRCARCGALARASDPWEPGHILDVAKGGTDHLANLQPEHRSCNRKAGAQLAAQRKKEAAERRAQQRIASTVAYLEDQRGRTA